MHSQGIYHGNIKASNIFIHNIEGRDLVQIGDFGISKFNLKSIKAKIMFELEIFETFEYITPEEILKQPISEKIDIWALGILLYRLLTYEHPFKGTENRETEKNIKNYPMKHLP